MRVVGRMMAAALLLCSSAVWAVEPNPAIGPAPAWVVAPTVPAPDPTKKDMPLQLLVTSTQERLTERGLENYVEYVAIPQNLAGQIITGI